MKKIYLLLTAFAIFSLQTQAQINKGSWMMGGGFGFNSGNNKQSVQYGSTTTIYSGKVSGFNLNPKAAYFPINNLAVGLSLQAQKVKTSTQYTSYLDVESQSSTLFGPFLRYYFPLGKAYLFGEASVGIGTNTTTTTSSSNTQTKTIHALSGYSFGPGAAFFFNDYIALDLAIKYNIVSEKYTEGTGNNATTYKDKIGGLGFLIGIQAYLGKKGTE